MMAEKAGKNKQAMKELEDAVRETLEGVKHKILVLSGKGGVGKSTVAANLAEALAAAGNKVGLLDIDLHGPSIPMLMGLTDRTLRMESDHIIPIEAGENLKVLSIGNLGQRRNAAVIWRGPLKMKAISQFIGDAEWGRLDYLIVDSPPGTGDEPLTIAQMIPGAGALIVTTPQKISLADVRRSVDFCMTVGMPIIGMVENMSGYVCPECGHHDDIFGAGGGERYAKEMHVSFLGRIPIDPAIVSAGDSGTTDFLRKNPTKSGDAFRRIVDSVAAQLEGGDTVTASMNGEETGI
jgi:Mrp family chromosome partitioning ATPase